MAGNRASLLIQAYLANAPPDPLMNKFSALAIILFTICLIIFATWQLFKGNLEAAFMPLPFLLVIYFFVKSGD